MLKIVYLGSPDFSAYLLEKLCQLPVNITGVITQKDKPVGRKKTLTPTPVKKTAQNLKLEVFEFGGWTEEIKEILKTSDLAILYSFSEIIPKEILSLPKYSFLNIHPSLLPKYRGASPIVYPLALGEEILGVSIIQMTEKLDAGPIIFQAQTKISKEESKEDIYFKLTEIAFQGLKNILAGDFRNLKSIPQDETKATYTRKLTKEDGFISWKGITEYKNGTLDKYYFPKFIKEYLEKYQPELLKKDYKIDLYNLYRALSPWPGLWTKLKIAGKEKRLKIIKVSKQNKILKVQLEGKNPVDFESFLKTAPIEKLNSNYQ